MIPKLAVTLREGDANTVIELLRLLLTVEPVPEAVVSIAVAINFGSSS